MMEKVALKIIDEDDFYCKCMDIVEAVYNVFEYRVGSKVLNYISDYNIDYDTNSISFLLRYGEAIIINPDLDKSIKINVSRCKKAIIEAYRENMDEDFFRGDVYEW